MDTMGDIAAAFAADKDTSRERTLDECVDLVPLDDDMLHAYIEAYYNYRIPTAAVCPGHVAPFQGVADLFFMREGDQIWTGGRGVGKTLNLSIAEHLLLRFYGDQIAHAGDLRGEDDLVAAEAVAFGSGSVV